MTEKKMALDTVRDSSVQDFEQTFGVRLSVARGETFQQYLNREGIGAFAEQLKQKVKSA